MMLYFSFSLFQKVVEFPAGSLPITPQAASAVMKRIQSKSSFDWDFSDEEHYPTIKASPNRYVLLSEKLS